MGINVSEFVRDRDNAFTAFVMNDDWESVRKFCFTYGVSMPDNPDVMATGIYKAVQECVNIPDKVKVKASIKCAKLGFSPYINFMNFR